MKRYGLTAKGWKVWREIQAKKAAQGAKVREVSGEIVTRPEIRKRDGSLPLLSDIQLPGEA